MEDQNNIESFHDDIRNGNLTAIKRFLENRAGDQYFFNLNGESAVVTALKKKKNKI